MISETCELPKTENRLFTPVNREGLLLRGKVTGFLVVGDFGWSNIFSIQASWRGRYLSHRLNKILQQQKKITFSNGRLLICKVFVCIQLRTLSTHVLIIKIIIPLYKRTKTKYNDKQLITDEIKSKPHRLVGKKLSILDALIILLNALFFLLGSTRTV